MCGVTPPVSPPLPLICIISLFRLLCVAIEERRMTSHGPSRFMYCKCYHPRLSILTVSLIIRVIIKTGSVLLHIFLKEIMSSLHN